MFSKGKWEQVTFVFNIYIKSNLSLGVVGGAGVRPPHHKPKIWQENILNPKSQVEFKGGGEGRFWHQTPHHHKVDQWGMGVGVGWSQISHLNQN